MIEVSRAGFLPDDMRVAAMVQQLNDHAVNSV